MTEPTATRQPLTAEQWLEYATNGLNGLYKLFKDDGWQPDCSLLEGLQIAIGQINEAVQLIRSQSEMGHTNAGPTVTVMPATNAGPTSSNVSPVSASEAPFTTVADLRLFSHDCQDAEDRELIQHAADLIEVLWKRTQSPAAAITEKQLCYALNFLGQHARSPVGRDDLRAGGRIDPTAG